MNIFARVAEFPRIPFEKKVSVSLLLSWALLHETCPQKLLAYQEAQFPTQTAQAPRYMQQSVEPLQQSVALIALYPDSLVSGILTASTFIEQDTEADRWVRSHPWFERRCFQASCRPTTIALQYRGARFISVLPWEYGQEPLQDIISRRSLQQPGTRCDGCRTVVRCREQALGNLKTTQQAVAAQGSTGPANKRSGRNFGGSDEYCNRPIATSNPLNKSTQAAREYAGPHDQSGVGSDGFSGYDHAEEKKKTAGKPQAKWQVGTVTTVRPYQVPDADPSVTSYKVSVRVGKTVYVVLNTPRPGTDIGRYARGRQVMVLVGDHTITYNDLLGNSFQVPILSRTTVTPRGSR